jgi:hypothetical protein
MFVKISVISLSSFYVLSVKEIKQLGKKNNYHHKNIPMTTSRRSDKKVFH